MPIIRKLCCAICVLVLFVSTARGAVTNLTIEGDEASADLELAGGIAAELTLRFESAVGLSERSLGLSVERVDPLSPELATLLPAGLSVPNAFPVQLTIKAPADGGLAFEGVVEIELYTQNLSYKPGTTLRLFSSSDGEAYRDITDAVSGGSYRVRGTSGQFSTFMILADERPLSRIVTAKFARLDGLLSLNAGVLEPVLAGSLNLLSGTANLLWRLGNSGAAIGQLRELGTVVETAAGTGLLPNVWQSSRDVENVAGQLRATVRTLSFSLGLALSGT